MRKGVESLPVTLDLGGGILVLENDPGRPPMSPFCGGGGAEVFQPESDTKVH